MKFNDSKNTKEKFKHPTSYQSDRLTSLWRKMEMNENAKAHKVKNKILIQKSYLLEVHLVKLEESQKGNKIKHSLIIKTWTQQVFQYTIKHQEAEICEE